MEDAKFDSWALLEIMGHQRYAGRVSEETIGGASLIRVDVPELEVPGRKLPGFTKMFGASSIFCITPCDEATARKAALSWQNIPFATFSAPALPAPSHYRDDVFHDEDDYDDSETIAQIEEAYKHPAGLDDLS